jgi:hypothetical protein
VLKAQTHGASVKLDLHEPLPYSLFLIDIFGFMFYHQILDFGGSCAAARHFLRNL